MTERQKITEKLIEYVNAMSDGQVVCREIIAARFLLQHFASRGMIKELLWALDRQDFVHITEKVDCLQCKSDVDRKHRMIVKLSDRTSRDEVMKKFKHVL